MNLVKDGFLSVFYKKDLVESKLVLSLYSQNDKDMAKEKLYRSVNGEYLYLFNWIGGGFNDVWASSKREAYAKVMRERRESAKKYPTHVKLTPDYNSMRKCTYTEYQAQNRMGWMMSM